MANKNSTWIVLAIVVMVFAVGFYYYDAEASTIAVEQTEEVQAALPPEQGQRPQGAARPARPKPNSPRK